MDTDTTDTTSKSAPATPERVYIEIPRAKPGQGYRAPKNMQRPLLDALAKLVTILLCGSLPAAPALIFALVLGFDPGARLHYLWLWIPMIVLIETIAVLVAIGLAREALAISGGNLLTRGKNR